MIKTQKIIIQKNQDILKWLEDSSQIYNQVLYFLRQQFFNARKQNRRAKYNNLGQIFNKIKIYDYWKNTTLDSVVKTAVIRQCLSNWFSYFKALKSYFKNKQKFFNIPKLPKYLKNGKTLVLNIDKTRIRHRNCLDNQIMLPKLKIKYKLPNYIKKEKIKCLRVLKFYNKIKLEICYEDNEIKNNLNKDSFIGIDIGLSNIVSITTNNQNKSWIIKGGSIKSINQFYNKKLAKLKSKLEICNKKKSSKKLINLSYKRNNKIDYIFHNISKKIIDLCLKNNIGNIVIGHNNNWKQQINLNKINNQNFVQIPFNKLINMIKYKANFQNINFFITEQSYTSKCDHLANEQMNNHNQYLGKRIKRGLFKSSINNKLINADINGAIGILRKINALTDVQLLNLRNRGDVVSPLMLKYY